MPGMMVTLGLNASQYERERSRVLKDSVSFERDLQRRVQGSPMKFWERAVAKGAEDQKKAAAEMAVQQQAMFAEIGKGSIPENFLTVSPAALAKAKSNMRVAATMFVSAIRDTFASLASGQNPITVFLQQAPQVMQGLVMMGGRVLALGLAFGVAAAAAVGLGAAINKWVNMYYQLDRLDRFGKKLEENIKKLRQWRREQEDANKAAAEAHEKYMDTLRNFGSAEDRLNDLLVKNRAKNAKTEAERHKILAEYLADEIDNAERKLNEHRSKRFSSDFEERKQYADMEIALEEAKQAKIDENERHRKTIEGRRRSSENVSERERIGLGTAPHAIQSGILAATKASESHLKNIEGVIRRWETIDYGSFG